MAVPCNLLFLLVCWFGFVHVVGVHDGDTITLLTAGQRNVRVRLAEIDAPELR